MTPGPFPNMQIKTSHCESMDLFLFLLVFTCLVAVLILKKRDEFTFKS